MIINGNSRYDHKLSDQDVFSRFYQTTGWNQRQGLDDEQVYSAISNSWCLVSTCVNRELAGFGHVVSDRILHALITEVIVHPDFQRNLLGTGVMRRLLKECCMKQADCEKGAHD